MTYCIINTTTSTKHQAVEIAKHLIEKKLAACVNIVPHIVSVYRWEDSIVESEEFLMIIKTRKSLYKKVEKTIQSMHEYSLPEIICTSIDKGSSGYTKWMREETKN